MDGKEVTTKLSDVFHLTADLLVSNDIEDFTVNQSSLDQVIIYTSDHLVDEIRLKKVFCQDLFFIFNI